MPDLLPDQFTDMWFPPSGTVICPAEAVGPEETRGFLISDPHSSNCLDLIIWHTQGSGKSLTMVWLAKWVRENITDARVLIITDRAELDEQIEKVFKGVDEHIYRTRSGADLLETLNKTNPWLVCSLVHKFGSGEGESLNEFLEQLHNKLPTNFSPKGNLYVFVDDVLVVSMRVP